MYKKLHKEYLQDPKNTTDNLKSIFPKSNLLDEAYERMSKIELLYNEDNLVSTFGTLEHISGTEEFHMIMLLGTLSARSAIYDNTNRNRYNVFVPLLMSAHKEINNVPYEMWDKEDKAIGLAVGTTLWKDLKNYLKPIEGLDDNLQELRNIAVSESKKASNQTGFYFTWLLSEDGKKVPKNISAIKGQFWFCHPNNRNEYMILDTINWDNMPASLVTDIDDIIIDDSNEYESMFGTIF